MDLNIDTKDIEKILMSKEYNQAIIADVVPDLQLFIMEDVSSLEYKDKKGKPYYSASPIENGINITYDRRKEFGALIDGQPEKAASYLRTKLPIKIKKFFKEKEPDFKF